MERVKFYIKLTIFVLLVLIVIMIVDKLFPGARQSYFEGVVVSGSAGEILIKIDPSHEKLIQSIGETVYIKKEEVLKECDFLSVAPAGEEIRVLYDGIDKKNKRIKRIFAIYSCSELSKLLEETTEEERSD